MMTFIPPRLRVPVRVAVAGTVLAAAWAVRGGPASWLSIVIEVGVVGRRGRRVFVGQGGQRRGCAGRFAG
jgi:hypothetical protein